MAEPFPGFLDWMGQQIGNQAMSSQGIDPQYMRFLQGAQQAGGQAQQLIPQGVDPQAIINAANMRNAGNIGVQAATGMNSGINAYHGSPYDFDAFDASKIGTGEGAQAYGHGLYFAGNEPVAQYYRDALATRAPTQFQIGADTVPEDQLTSRLVSGFGMPTKFAASRLLNDVANGRSWADIRAGSPDKWGPVIDWLEQNKVAALPRSEGKMYQVSINAQPEQFLDWDKPLSEQSQRAQQNLEDVLRYQQVPAKNNVGAPTTVGQMVDYLERRFGNKADATAELRDSGIPGIRYLDQGSRGAGQGTSNYVVFDPSIVEILRKYGMLGMIGGGGAAATMSPQQQ